MQLSTSCGCACGRLGRDTRGQTVAEMPPCWRWRRLARHPPILCAHLLPLTVIELVPRVPNAKVRAKYFPVPSAWYSACCVARGTRRCSQPAGAAPGPGLPSRGLEGGVAHQQRPRKPVTQLHAPGARYAALSPAFTRPVSNASTQPIPQPSGTIPDRAAPSPIPPTHQPQFTVSRNTFSNAAPENNGA